MARVKQTARKKSGGKAPRSQLAQKSGPHSRYDAFLRNNNIKPRSNQDKERARRYAAGAISLSTLHALRPSTFEEARVTARARYVSLRSEKRQIRVQCRFIQDAFYRGIENALCEDRVGLYGSSLLLHCYNVVGCAFFVEAKGEVNLDLETSELRLIKDKNWYRLMSVEKSTVEGNIGEIQRAHREFFSWTKGVVGELDVLALNSTPVPRPTWVGWTDSLTEMVLGNHWRFADWTEVSLMRSLDQLKTHSRL